MLDNIRQPSATHHVDNEIPEMLLNKLIEAGKTNDFSQISSLLTTQEQNTYRYIMRLRPEPWLNSAENLNEEELVSLIKCLTIIECNYDGWMAGSVSPVIWLFRKLSSFEPVFLHDVADWVLANTKNGYLPFGTMNLGAKSIVEFTQLKKLSSERRKTRHETEVKRQDLARARKAQKATLALFGAVKRSDIKAVKALIAKGADITAKDSENISVTEYAQMKGNKIILELLIPSSSSE
jgi:hypothetical protein